MAKKPTAKPAKATAKRASAKTVKPRKAAPSSAAGLMLLSGGNPQIAKGYGDTPVQAYIAAMPGWKGDVGRRIDAIVTRAVPHAFKAVKWNSPLYGVERDRWFIGVHCMTKYVKVAFFMGQLLRPKPPGESSQKNVRYLDIYEGEFDEAKFVNWVKQASKLPGEKM